MGKNKITVTIPNVNIFNSRLVGDVSLENKQGLLKRIFENNDGYNQAVSALVTQAEQNLLTPEVLTNANNKAVQEIERLVGYLVRDKEIEVVIK